MRTVSARTKGKDECGVRYVKGNAIAGTPVRSWAGLESHLVWWMRRSPTGVGTARRGDAAGPLRARGGRLGPCAGRPPFGQLRDLIRTVHADCSVTLGTNAYSVPWRLIGDGYVWWERRSGARVPRSGLSWRSMMSTTVGTGDHGPSPCGGYQHPNKESGLIQHSARFTKRRAGRGGPFQCRPSSLCRPIQTAAIPPVHLDHHQGTWLLPTLLIDQLVGRIGIRSPVFLVVRCTPSSSP